MSRMFKITSVAFEITKSGSITMIAPFAYPFHLVDDASTPESIVSYQNMFKSIWCII